jgi:hypothetical protein
VTNHPSSPTPRLVSIDRRQNLLRTVDVENLIDENRPGRVADLLHLARQVVGVLHAGRVRIGLRGQPVQVVIKSSNFLLDAALSGLCRPETSLPGGTS